MAEDFEVIETATAHIRMRHDGIMCVTIVSGSEQTSTDVAENIAHVATLNKGKKCPILIDITESKGIDREGRHYAASDEVSKHITGMAVLIKSPFSRVMGNLWLKTTQPSFPTQLFMSKQKAFEWLLTNDN